MKTKKHLSFSSLRTAMSKVFSNIPDHRQESKVEISLHDALMSGFACMHFQEPSLLQFQEKMQKEQNQNNLKTLFAVERIPKQTQMRSIIDGVDNEYLRPIFKECYNRLHRGKHLEQFQILPSIYYSPMDGSQFYKSKDVHCKQCLVKHHKKDCPTYSHQVLQGGIAHPDCKQVIPFMPEQVSNIDGTEKQDCEMNAAKRYVNRLKEEFPRLKLLLGGDSLFSRQPIIEDILAKNFHYLFVAKPQDHKYMMEFINEYDDLDKIEITDEKGKRHLYEWINYVPLNGQKETVHVNYLRYTIMVTNNSGEEKISYRNSWVTDLEITKENAATLVRAGRCRWKSESAPQAHRVMMKGIIMKCCKAIGKMVVGPPKSAVRSRFQTTSSGCY